MFHIPPPPDHVLHAYRRSTGDYLGVIYQMTDRRGRLLPMHNYRAADYYMIENGAYVQAEDPKAVKLTWTMR